MAGFSGSHGGLDRFIISHFAKKDHIRTLSQSGSEGHQIAFRICAYFALADNTFVMPVQIFQRVFQGDDVTFPGMIDTVNNTCHCCGFTASCRSCNKYHSFGKIRNRHNIFRNIENSGIGKFKSNYPDNCSKRTSLAVGINTKTGKSGDGKRKVIISDFQKTVKVTVVGHLINLP